MRRDQSSWTFLRPKSALLERQSSCIPSQIVEAVPACAITCVENFIQTEYSTSCTNTSSLQFLCVTPNPSGFALGEAALRCVVSNCSSTSPEGLVYNICAGIMDAVPETIATITATVAPTSLIQSSVSSQVSLVTSAALPLSIANPSTMQILSTFVTATETPSIVTSASAPSSTTSNTPDASVIQTSTLSTISSTISANPETTTSSAAVAANVQNGSLSTGSIAGIAVAGVVAAAAGCALLFFIFCLREKRKNRRRVSQRWSTAAFPLPPPDKDVEKIPNVPAPTFSANSRYYTSAPAREQRRSFWRKSINPIDIGVALSPGKKAELTSPASISSQKSASKLLANSEAPSMWPASLLNFPPPPKDTLRQAGDTLPGLDMGTSRTFSNKSTYPIYAPYETRLPQSQQQLSQGSYTRPINSIARINIQAPYETRLTRLPPVVPSTKSGPPPVNRPNQAYDAERARGAAITGRIPLTPIYDNGNFATTPYGKNTPVAYRWDTPESMNQLFRPALHATAQAPIGLNIANATARAPPPRKESFHKSVASDITNFEEDTTPEEELERQLRTAQSRPVNLREGPRSPIQNLAYPKVPRPAAVSRQAQHVPRPLAGQNVTTTASAAGDVTRGLSQRYGLHRGRADYLLNETTSSSAGAPSLAQRRIVQKKDLRIRTPNEAAYSSNSRWQVMTQQIAPPPIARKAVPLNSQTKSSFKQASPQARVTPKTNSRGDLYLMVED